MAKKKKIWSVVLVAAIILGALAISRYSNLTTYVPFSGRVFAVDPEQVDTIFIQNGTTGEQYFFNTPEEKIQITDQLNKLRHGLWIPIIPVAKGGWSYRIAIEMDDRRYSYTFGNASMTVGPIVFMFPGGQLDALREYVD